MPRLVHRPPKYSHHKGTGQATVTLSGKRIYLGPFGSPESHGRNQEILQSWQSQQVESAATTSESQTDTDEKASEITAAWSSTILDILLMAFENRSAGRLTAIVQGSEKCSLFGLESRLRYLSVQGSEFSWAGCA